MRRGFLEHEADDGTAIWKTGTLQVIHADRSEAGGDDYCPQFTPWVPHLSFEQHWEERKTYLLERDNRKFLKEINDSAERTQRAVAHGQVVTQWVIAVLTFVTILVSIALNVFGSSRTTVQGPVPVIITSPSTPSIEAPPPTKGP